jgi:hypothetical protein
MGGSGGGRGLTPDELKKMEDIAKKELKDTEPQKRNVFISFASEDLNEVNLLRGQAKNSNSELEFSDRSLQEPFNSENADYIKRGIRDRINQASVTIVYISENTSKSDWVDWEIRQSVEMGKGVIAMYKGDTPPKNLPPAIKELKVKLVPWNHDMLSQAIENAAK